MACKESDECSHLKNTKCMKLKCKCKAGFFNKITKNKYGCSNSNYE